VTRPYPTPPPLTRERQLSVVLRQPADGATHGHTGGVGALLLLAGHDAGAGSPATALFSGSRDATVRRWAVEANATTAPDAASRFPSVSISPTACWRGHGGWVNALAAPAPGLVASASSDRTIKLWRSEAGGGGDEEESAGIGGAPASTSAAAAAPHKKAGALVATLAGHADYVTCLAAAPGGAPGRLASAGLGAQVLVWDVSGAANAAVSRVGMGEGSDQPSTTLPSSPTLPWTPPVTPAAAARDSVYALAMDGSGTLIAAGAPSGALRLADARTGAPTAALRGHAPGAVVRSVALSPDGRRALSGGSDATLRLWDVGTRRCIATLAVHTDSVWAVAVPPEGGDGPFSSPPTPTPPARASGGWGDAFLSGGRDGRVYAVDARARSAALVCEGAEPVTALALDGRAGVVWVGRERAAGVEGWAVPAVADAGARATGECVSSPSAAAAAAAAAAGGGRPALLPPGGAFPVSASPLVRARQTFSEEGCGGTGGAAPTHPPPPPRTAPPPASANPAAVAPGAGSPIIAATVLPDRRHVLTQSLDGAVEEWDVCAGAVVAVRAPPGSPPGIALSAAARARWSPASVPPWFTADASSGRLALVLAPPGCFSAELYAADLGWAAPGGAVAVAAAPDDLKVNAGQELLRAALSRWAAGQRKMAHAGEESGGEEDAQPPPPPPPSPPPPAPLFFRLPGAECGAPSPSIPSALLIGEGGDPAGLPWVATVAGLTGGEPCPALVPAWAADAVLRGRLAGERGGGGKDAKVAFLLHPAPGSGLPALPTTRLSAPRVLPLRKVATYAASKLAETAGMEVALLPCFWDEERQAAADAAVVAEDAAAAAAGSPPPARLEITLAGYAAPHDLSLAAARAHLWRRGEDLPFSYRLVRGGEGRAPRVVLKAPAE